MTKDEPAARRSRMVRVALFVLISLPSYAAEPDLTLLLDVVLNGRSLGKIAEFWLRKDVLLTRPSELHDLGIRHPAGSLGSLQIVQSTLTDEPIPLSDLRGVTWRIDEQTQTVYLKVPDSSLLPSILDNEEGGSTRSPRTIDSGNGLTLNYDIAATTNSTNMGASGSLDMRIFSPFGVVSSGLLGYANSGGYTSLSQGSARQRIIRLDTAYTFADVNTLRRYSLGDFITGGLDWTRPVRLAGVQVRSDFSMRPDLITFPVPKVSGSAAVPSTVNVLANGNLVLSRQVEAGPFEIPQLPVVNGASSISMTITNAVGQQVTVTQPFYASVALLAPGLHTYSAQAGMVRRRWGVISNDYGKLAGVGNYRRGITRALTLEANAEGTGGIGSAGGGAILRAGDMGVFNVAMAGSAGSGIKGAQWSLGFRRIGTMFSFGATEIVSTRGFQDVAAGNGSPVPRQQLSANGGVFLRHFGSLGVAYAGVKQDASLHPSPLYPAEAQNAKVISASYSLQFRRMSIYANHFRSFTNDGASGVQMGVTLPLSRRSSVDVSEGTGQGHGQIRVQQSAAQVGEWGYNAYMAAGQLTHEFAQVQYKATSSLLTVGIDQNGSESTFRSEVQGALSFVDRAFFLSNTIFDSFAIVDTNGLGEVRVLQENRDVGATDRTGRLLVPDMRAFQLNHLGINPTDVPLDTSIDIDTREIRPQDRSGVIVRFPVKVSHGALLRLVDETGVPLPVGSTVTLRGTHVAFPVGYEGEAYVENLGPHNEIETELPSGRRCAADFFYLPLKGVIPVIGPIHCQIGRP